MNQSTQPLIRGAVASGTVAKACALLIGLPECTGTGSEAVRTGRQTRGGKHRRPGGARTRADMGDELSREKKQGILAKTLAAGCASAQSSFLASQTSIF